ncbi:MAG: 2-dehydro-3-deoxy-6-phosphogalactonate aldolase [Methylobacteriaceae bacterium]|nr:2-dehydro-3-deoxy-6-phosphogalactonate aldolase [Methylobacteriaceae bacterium]
MNEPLFDRLFAELPLIAILRGVTPDECVGIGEALVAAGIRIVEVPMNSPDPLASIERLAQALGGRALVGAGTVYRPEDVEAIARAGGQIIVTPHTDGEIIRRTRDAGLVSAPGCFTPSEAAAALAAGAHILKLFPGELVTPASVRAMAAVLPKGTRFVLVGGVSADNIAYWRGSAIHGFGIGSSLYKPGLSPQDVGLRAADLIVAYRAGE